MVIPVALSGFPLSQLPYPLAGIQGHTIDDIGYIIDAIANRCGAAEAKIDLDEYLRDLREAERSLNYKSLRIEPRLEGQQLKFDITNDGNVDLELLMLEVMVPSGVRYHKGVIPLEWEMNAARKPGYAWLACYSPRGAYGNFSPALRPIITPSMSTIRPNVSIMIRGPLSQEEREMPIYFQVHAVGYRTQLEERKLRDLGA
ncbi:MAG TPA: hypothetical protein VIY49_25670 [Bryobacteraceae bacterium]